MVLLTQGKYLCALLSPRYSPSFSFLVSKHIAHLMEVQYFRQLGNTAQVKRQTTLKHLTWKDVTGFACKLESGCGSPIHTSFVFKAIAGYVGIHLCPVDLHNKNNSRGIFLIPPRQLCLGEELNNVLFKFMAFKCSL